MERKKLVIDLNKGLEIMGLLVKIQTDLTRKLKEENQKQMIFLEEENSILKQLEKIEAEMRNSNINPEKAISVLKKNIETPHLIKVEDMM